MKGLDDLLATLKVEANVFHNGQYCGAWAVDTTGSERMNFHIVTVGHCYICVGEESILLSQGDAVIMPTDSPHAVSNDECPHPEQINKVESTSMTETLDENATGLVCGNFSHQNPIFHRLVEHLPDLIIVRADEVGSTKDILALILQEARDVEKSNSFILNRLADCLFYTLVREHLSEHTGVFAALVHPKLNVAMSMMHEQLDRKLSLDTLAGAAGMSRTSFVSLFRELVGYTPNEYLVQWRMAQAYRWLADEGASTFDAAQRTGYESEASFSKAFKRVMGVGPGKVRLG